MARLSQAAQPVASEANKLLPEDRAAHRWYRFVLSFPPHLVREYLERFEVGQDGHVLDPFCGTGTTLVECKKRGIASTGIEAHPMAYFASRVKVDWSPDAAGLLEHAQALGAEALECLRRDGIEDGPFFTSSGKATRKLRSLPPETARLLLRESISALPLHKTLVLLETMDRRRDDAYYSHERLAMAKALVAHVGNLHFGPEVRVGPRKTDAPVVEPWLGEVSAIASDLRSLRELDGATTDVYQCDSRHMGEVLQPESINAVITSPPYPNEKDYTRTTRLETVFLGLVRTKAELQHLKRSMIRSNTRGVYKGDDDDRWVARHPEIQRVAQEIENRRTQLGKTSGFERLYHRVTTLYFGGMLRHLRDLRTYLQPGAQLAYVVGDQASYLRVMIRTGTLLADIAKSLGYEVTGIDLFRTRLATATREQLREEVVLLRWSGHK